MNNLYANIMNYVKLIRKIILLEINLMPCFLIYPAIWQFISLQMMSSTWYVVAYIVLLSTVSKSMTSQDL